MKQERETRCEGIGKRIGRVSLLYGGILLAGLAYLWLYRRLGFGIPCIFHELTGLSCPGCGLTRAASALSQGRIREALSWNPMLPVYVAYFLWTVPTATVRYVRGERDPILFGPDWLHILMLAATLLFGLVRIILGLVGV